MARSTCMAVFMYHCINNTTAPAIQELYRTFVSFLYCGHQLPFATGFFFVDSSVLIWLVWPSLQQNFDTATADKMFDFTDRGDTDGGCDYWCAAYNYSPVTTIPTIIDIIISAVSNIPTITHVGFQLRFLAEMYNTMSQSTYYSGAVFSYKVFDW